MVGKVERRSARALAARAPQADSALAAATRAAGAPRAPYVNGVEHEHPEESPRVTSRVRHLPQAAEREPDARTSLTDALDRLLDVRLPRERGVMPLLEAVASASGDIDAAGVLWREGDAWEVRASVGFSPAHGRLPADASDGALAEAARSRRPVLVSARSALVPSPPLPPGTRAAYAVPLLARGEALLGVALFGSRSAHELAPEELLLARLASARAAHALDRASLELEIARCDEVARRTAAFRDQILAIVGHDLRNPLGAIVMSAALLQKRGGLAGWQARTVDRVRASSARMGRIISDLLSYTRTRLGVGIPITRHPADLGELANRVVEELRAAHPEASIIVAMEGDLAGEWDVDRIEQLASNLVSNAIDHGEEEQPVEVRLAAAGDAVRIEVANRGEMPPDVISHAFEAFHRGPDESGRKASGLGLGLYIAREIARRHGGEIALTSASGATHVAVTLPRRG
jgi:signal transduction histidine kinase